MDPVEAIRKIYEGHPVTPSLLTSLLRLPDEEFDPLRREADAACSQIFGDRVFVRGIVEFSNICSKDCLYCGLRRSNTRLRRYRMSPEEILDACHGLARAGIATVVLQSGEDPWWTDDRLARLVEAVRRIGLVVTLSVGERSYDSYRRLLDAGAERYLLRIETTDRDLFRRLHPDDDFDRRLACLHDLRDLGYETGTGTLIGLPGQTEESLAQDLLFFLEFRPDMVGLGPFLPHHDTPLAAATPAPFGLTLKMVSLTRLLLKGANIPATTAMGTAHPRGRQLALASGANVLMPNATPRPYRSLYTLYDNKVSLAESGQDPWTVAETVAREAGKRAVRGPGSSPWYKPF